jgi:hypothetical protein
VFDYGPQEVEHVFCLRCGSHVWVDANGGEKAYQAKTEKAKAKGDEEAANEKDIVAVNVSYFSLKASFKVNLLGKGGKLKEAVFRSVC